MALGRAARESPVCRGPSVIPGDAGPGDPGCQVSNYALRDDTPAPGFLRASPPDAAAPGRDLRSARRVWFVVRSVLSFEAPATKHTCEVAMTVKYRTIGSIVVLTGVLATPAFLRGQATAEVFTATASVKGAGGGSASAPVTITVDRKMSASEAEKLTAAFKSGGAAALRKALAGVSPTGSVKVGAGSATPTRITIERSTGNGRLLTIVTDQPVLFVGAGMPGAKPKEGYDFSVTDIEVDAQGNGSGTWRRPPESK